MKKIRLFIILFCILLVVLSYADSKFNSGRIVSTVFHKVEAIFDRGKGSSGVAHQPIRSSVQSIPGSEKIRLASWNIRIFSSKSRDDFELEKICNVMQNFDIIAIQELKDTEVMDRAIAMLKKTRGLEYKYVWSRKVGTRTHKEFYAIMYRPDIIQYLGDGKTYADLERVFIREPFYASFRAGNFDFTLATIHVLYGKGKKDPKRRAELDAIARVYKMIQKSNPNENDVILTGDFNESPSSGRFEEMFKIDSIRFLIGEPIKTVIFDSSLYDNIIFQSKYTNHEYSGSIDVYKFDEIDFDNDDKAAKMAVSDHRPVWAEFCTNKSDDD